MFAVKYRVSFLRIISVSPKGKKQNDRVCQSAILITWVRKFFDFAKSSGKRQKIMKKEMPRMSYKIKKGKYLKKKRKEKNERTE